MAKKKDLIPLEERRKQELALLAEWEAENSPKGRSRIIDRCVCYHRVEREVQGTEPQGVRWCLRCQQPMDRKVTVLIED